MTALAILFLLTVYLLAKLNLFFTILEEGTAVAIMRSAGGFDHFIMKWNGHYLNDPRQPWYNPGPSAWEVLGVHPDNADQPPSIYRFPVYWLAPVWRMLEHFGIYYYGLYPFKQVHSYTFDWTEQRIKEGTNDYEPWHRVARTSFIYVKRFSYWVRLLAAEDEDNIPLDLDYLLTVMVNNPYKALFSIGDWLARTIADANNRAKTFTGASTFEDMTKERTKRDQAQVNEFSSNVLQINDNVWTEHGLGGTRESYGVTVAAVSLVEVALAGENRQVLAAATTAKIVAKKNAEAAVETAEGAAKAVKIAADAEKYAVDTVYSEIERHGAEGIAIRQLDSIVKAGDKGNQIIWANNPILDAVREFMRGFRTTPPSPPSATNS